VTASNDGSPVFRFSVDTHLFQELGTLLVARESTALAELIKNAYDADATQVVIVATGLRDASGNITINDNGIGITEAEFVEGFLRVAASTKRSGDRRSTVYGRRYTGAKGIGRLAAHKLGRVLQLESKPNHRLRKYPPISATIDWDEVERHETLDLTDHKAIRLAVEPKAGASDGTRIRLDRLRRRWTTYDVNRFIAEATSIHAPPLLSEPLPRTLVDRSLLFGKPRIRDTDSADPGMAVVLRGDFAAGDDLWQVIEAEIEWIIELRARREGIQLVVAPTARVLAQLPDAKSIRIKREHFEPKLGPFFDARIFVRRPLPLTQTTHGDELKKYTGIRVYMEGFRVLPYGDTKDDWLDLTREYTLRRETMLFEKIYDEDPERERIGLVQVPPAGYFGAVFLTERDSPDFEMLVNREGFNDTAGFERLHRLIRWSVHQMLRTRAAATAVIREAAASKRADTRSDDPSSAVTESRGHRYVSPATVRRAIDETVTTLDSATKTFEKRGDSRAAGELLQIANTIRSVLEPLKARLETDLEMLRILAAVGLQLSIFVHEINGLLNLVTELEVDVEALDPSGVAQRRVVSRINKTLDDLRRNLERQASYLADVATTNVRRRRTPQPVATALGRALALLQSTIDDNEIHITVNIPADLKSPKIFAAELRSILTNLLTNAIKAASTKVRDRRIGVRAVRKDDEVIIRVENTGEAVDLKDAERLFNPFVSTTEEADPVLGQGMGLGLSITRALVEQAGGTVRFVRPSGNYKTAIEVRLRGGR
jgi:signal transduction histidine kinase